MIPVTKPYLPDREKLNQYIDVKWTPKFGQVPKL
jgi:hypothetical protein